MLSAAPILSFSFPFVTQPEASPSVSMAPVKPSQFPTVVPRCQHLNAPCNAMSPAPPPGPLHVTLLAPRRRRTAWETAVSTPG